MICAGPQCQNEITPTGVGRPPLYCSDRCRKRAYRLRKAEESGRQRRAEPAAAAAPRPAETDEQVAVALLEAERLSGALIRLGSQAQPRLAWRCRMLGDVIACAIDDYFEGVL
jgi:hypothetical protein